MDVGTTPNALMGRLPGREGPHRRRAAAWRHNLYLSLRRGTATAGRRRALRGARLARRVKRGLWQ